jgi:hypothetical protein
MSRKFQVSWRLKEHKLKQERQVLKFLAQSGFTLEFCDTKTVLSCALNESGMALLNFSYS